MRIVPSLVHFTAAVMLAGMAAAGPAASDHLGAVEFTFTLERPMYAPGEVVRFALTMANTGSEPAVVEFATSQPYDVIVVQSGRVVWQWSAGMVFLQVLTRVPLNPGESRAYDVIWNQQDASGRPVPPGDYTAEARFPVMGVPRITARVPFRIGGAAGSSWPVVSARAKGTLAAVMVSGRVALRMREPAGGLSAVERAEIIAARLRLFLEQGLAPAQLAVVTIGGETAIAWRNRLIVTVDAHHARLNRSTPVALAGLWRRQLAAALSP